MNQSMKHNTIISRFFCWKNWKKMFVFDYTFLVKKKKLQQFTCRCLRLKTTRVWVAAPFFAPSYSWARYQPVCPLHSRALPVLSHTSLCPYRKRNRKYKSKCRLNEKKNELRFNAALFRSHSGIAADTHWDSELTRNRAHICRWREANRSAG